MFSRSCHEKWEWLQGVSNLYYVCRLQEVTFYGSQFIDNRLPEEGAEVKVEGLSKPAVVNSDGMYIYGSDGKKVSKPMSVLEQTVLDGTCT